MKECKNFLDQNAWRYDRFMRKDAAAYAKMYELIRPTIRHKTVQDMFHLPYADKSFDTVIVANALHIVPEPERALREIRRVLKASFPLTYAECLKSEV